MTEQKTEGTKIWHFAYSILGNKLERVFPKFRDIRKSIHRALLMVSYRAYVSFMFFISILTFLVAAACSSMILLLFTVIGIVHMGILSFLLWSLGISGLAALIAFLAAYFYPSIKANSRKGSLEGELPYAASYMSILSSAGSSPHKVFHSLSTTKTLPSFTNDAKVILRDMNLLGQDMFTAIKNAVERSPSQRYSLFLEGLIATIRSGGDLTKYLNEESKELMRVRTLEVRKFLDSLGLIAESYISMLVAFPLILIIMLGVMSTLGGSLGGISITGIMYILTYLVIPFLAAMVIILIDAMSPK
jgi:flagellar protein FlaJ